MLALLSPHLDDAVLSLWHLLDGPADVTVVNVFAGVPQADGGGDRWWDHVTGATDSAQRVHERRAEDREALGLAGRTAVDIGLLEAQYRDRPQAVEPVVERLAEALPDSARVLAPAALDGHRSHRVVRAAALALREAGRATTLYADVPHATCYGWPAWVSGAAANPHLHPDALWRRHLAEAGIALDELGAEIHRLDDRAYERKLTAVRSYATQLPALEAGFGVLSRPDVLRYEVLWPLP